MLGLSEYLFLAHGGSFKEAKSKIRPFFKPKVGAISFAKFWYDLWGNTVNTASRMESTSQHGWVRVSQSTYEALKDVYDFEDVGLMECKGLGKIRTH